MALGGSVGEKAAQEIHETVDGALETIEHKVMPAAEQVGKSLSDRMSYAAAGIVADVFNRANGAKLPVDLTLTMTATFKLTGSIGGLELVKQEYDVTRS